MRIKSVAMFYEVAAGMLTKFGADSCNVQANYTQYGPDYWVFYHKAGSILFSGSGDSPEEAIRKCENNFEITQIKKTEDINV